MKRSSATLKMLARQTLSGKFGLPLAAYLIIGVLSFTLTLIITELLDTSSLMSIITNQLLIYLVSIFMSLLLAGYDKMLLNLSRKEPYLITDIFHTFSHNPDRFLIVNLLLLLGGILTSLPFDIPVYMDTGSSWEQLSLSLAGLLVRSLTDILLAAFFGLANYLLLDNPEMGAMEAMKESLKLMKGNKRRYLHLYLSFLPLAFVSVFTCYIGFLWLTPYIRTTMAAFYRDIMGELDKSETGTNQQDSAFSEGYPL